MYKCQVCQCDSEPGETIQVHRIYRQVPYFPSERKVNSMNLPHLRPEIAREVPVCNECQILLLGGIPLHMLLKQRGQPKRMGTCEIQTDKALIGKLKNKTLIVRDGDSLLKQSNVSRTLTEARDLYDGEKLTPEQKKQLMIDKFKAKVKNNQ